MIARRSNYVFVFFGFSILLLGCSSGKSYSNQIKNHRENYQQSFLSDPRSPLQKEDMVYLDFFKPNKNWVKKAVFEHNTQTATINIPTYSGIEKPYSVYGYITFMHGDDEVKMEIYKSAQKPENPLYKNHLFLPFKDHSNGETTYGGGRYIDLSVSQIQDQTLTIDFNKCYNPWCAYSEGFNCPVPPKANHLPFRVWAGEKSYKGDIKKL